MKIKWAFHIYIKSTIIDKKCLNFNKIIKRLHSARVQITKDFDLIMNNKTISTQYQRYIIKRLFVR